MTRRLAFAPPVALSLVYLLRVRSSPRLGRFEPPFTLKKSLEVAR